MFWGRRRKPSDHAHSRAFYYYTFQVLQPYGHSSLNCYAYANPNRFASSYYSSGRHFGDGHAGCLLCDSQ
ncbi:MAG TPA: hypothetical protein VNL15_06555 [Dehalococcoidia bacterium]|nr:hypothetical protein [Dehalococcoidia bacterium]